MAKTRIIVIDQKDNVATALEPIKAGTEVSIEIKGSPERIRLLVDIPRGHKLAFRDIKKGDFVIKYGEPIGQSLTKITRGELVHVHNLASRPRLKEGR